MDDEFITVITPICVNCRSTGFMRVKKEDLDIYHEGRVFVQDCFPYLRRDELEQIKTGIHPKCWIEMFGEEE